MVSSRSRSFRPFSTIPEIQKFVRTGVEQRTAPLWRDTGFVTPYPLCVVTLSGRDVENRMLCAAAYCSA